MSNPQKQRLGESRLLSIPGSITSMFIGSAATAVPGTI